MVATCEKMRYVLLLISIIFCLELDAQVNNFTKPEWQVLRTHIGESSIVGLGEINHGYENINLTKSIILNFLTNKLDFKNVIFESSFSECIISFLQKNSFQNRFQHFVYPFWNTSSVRNAIEPIYNKEKEDNKIRLLGCDIQEDCRFLKLSEYLIKEKLIVENLNKLSECDSILSLYIGVNRSKNGNLNATEFTILNQNYNLILQEMQLQKKLVVEKQKLVLRCIQNRKWLCEYLTISNINKRMKFRDSLMADNIIWLVDEIIKNEKTIIWAASLHVAKKKNKNDKAEWMGEFLTSKFTNNYYTISIQKGISPTSKFLENDFKIKYQSDNERFNTLIYLTTLEKIKSIEWVIKCD